MRVFDLDDPSHDAKLRLWCRVHWSATIKKSMDSYNSLTFHDCCFSFSRRGYTKRWDHPILESFPISKIPTLKLVSSEEELHSWLRNRMQERAKAGKTMVFPSVNTRHLLPPDQRDTDLSPCQTEFLRKRLVELSQEKQEVLSQIDKLKNDNARLHASSKSWFDKYQEAIQSREQSIENTPVKKKNIIHVKEEDLLFLED